MYPIFLAALISANISQWAAEYRQYLEGLDWTQVATVVIAGVGIVLAVLIIFVFIFKAFGRFGSALTKNKKQTAVKPKTEKKKEAFSPAPAAAVSNIPASPVNPAAPAVQQGISGEIIAAIAAAVTAYEGGKPVSIRAIKVKNVSGRNPWAAAAMADNARPF